MPNGERVSFRFERRLRSGTSTERAGYGGALRRENASCGTRQLAATGWSLHEQFDFPIFLNADYTRLPAKALEAIKAGFDSVVLDLSTLPLEENAYSIQQAVEALKSVNPAVLVEGEIGDIGSGSEIHADRPGPHRALTTPQDTLMRSTRNVAVPVLTNWHPTLIVGHKGP